MTTTNFGANAPGSSFFLINGDSLLTQLSPSTQLLPPALVGLQSNKAYWDANQVPGVQKFWATLKGSRHNDVLGQPTCATADPPNPPLCQNGLTPYLGYLTAWMVDRLMDNPGARGAFVNTTGEVFGNPRYQQPSLLLPPLHPGPQSNVTSN